MSDEILDGMNRWEPGTLGTGTLERILTDAMADLWRDCYRRDNPQFQRDSFSEKLERIAYEATGERFIVATVAHVGRPQLKPVQ